MAVRPRDQDNAQAWRRSVALSVAVGIGVLTIAGYASQVPHGWRVASSGLMAAAAALGVGGLVGFLFGIPRTLTSEVGNRTSSGEAAGVRRPAYGANTNLEQVSDWLTKILLGVGLTQLGPISRAVGRLIEAIASGMGDPEIAVPFTGALLTYFAVLGFVVGWLATRLYLAPAMSGADRQAYAMLVAAAAARAEGDTAEADRLNEEAVEVLGGRSEIARRYEELRDALPKGEQRTRESERLVSEARTASGANVTREAIKAVFESGKDGDRMYALGYMQGHLDTADLECALEAIRQPRSNFEQRQGLLLAQMIAATLNPADRERLAAAVEKQLTKGKIRPGGDRHTIAQALLATLATMSQYAGRPS